MYRRSFTVLALIFAVVCTCAAPVVAEERPRIVEKISVGTDPPAWAARAFLPVFVPNLPNLHLEAPVLQRRPFGSLRLHQRAWRHGELTYILPSAGGAGDISEASLDGQAVTRVAQAGTILELPSTSAAIDGQPLQRVEHPWEALAGLALLWRHLHLIVGAGDGHIFVPGADLAHPSRGFVPDGWLSLVL